MVISVSLLVVGLGSISTCFLMLLCIYKHNLYTLFFKEHFFPVRNCQLSYQYKHLCNPDSKV